MEEEEEELIHVVADGEKMRTRKVHLGERENGNRIQEEEEEEEDGENEVNCREGEKNRGESRRGRGRRLDSEVSRQSRYNNSRFLILFNCYLDGNDDIATNSQSFSHRLAPPGEQSNGGNQVGPS